MQLFINYSFDSDCVHIYVNNLIQLHKQQWVGVYPFKMIFITHKSSKWFGDFSHFVDY
jgi:hypothetical protein